MIISRCRRRLKENRRGAFTLLEVLVVVAILVVLASVSSIYVFRNLEDSRKTAAETSAKSLAKAAEAFALRNGDLPENLEQLRPYMNDSSGDPFSDPWGKKFQYAKVEINGKEVPQISTNAPDGTRISNVKQ